jgi:hypothetical protein
VEVIAALVIACGIAGLALVNAIVRRIMRWLGRAR